MEPATTSALVLAGLESAKLLLGIVKHKMDEKEVKLFDYARRSS